MSAAIRVAAATLTLVLAAVIVGGALRSPATLDFAAQYAAARLVAQGRGADVLDDGAVLGIQREVAPERERLLPFVQPPAVALLLSPFAALPFGAAHILMAATDALLILVSLALLRARGLTGALPAFLLFVAPPAVIAVVHAQTSPLVLALVALATARTAPQGGFALGLTLLRPQTAPLILLAGLLDPARRWWCVAGSVAVVIASLLVVGADGLARYVTRLVDAAGWSATGELGLASAIGWSGVAAWLGAPWLALALPLASLALGAVAVARADRDHRVVVAAAWSLLASPHVLMHDALLAYPAVVMLSGRRALWDVASVLAWLVHLLVAPLGALWSAVLAARAVYPRAVRGP